MLALGTAVAIVALIYVVKGVFFNAGSASSEQAAGRAHSSVTALMPTTTESLAGFELFLSRCKNTPQCPYYALSLKGDSLMYVGVRDVMRQGKLTETVAQERKRKLLTLVREAGFFALDNSYGLEDPGCNAKSMDAATFKVGVTLNGQTKIVNVNMGCTNVPPQLVSLAQGIDRVVQSAHWTGVIQASGEGG